MTSNNCPHCGGDDIFSHRPFAHTKEIRFYCAGCGQRLHNYKRGPRGLGKLTVVREPPKPVADAPHPVSVNPTPRGAKRLKITGGPISGPSFVVKQPKASPDHPVSVNPNPRGAKRLMFNK